MTVRRPAPCLRPAAAIMRIRRIRPACPLRLSLAVICELRRLRLETPFIPRHLDSRAIVVAAAVAAGSVGAALRIAGGPGSAIDQPDPPSIVVMVLDRIPTPDVEDPRESGATAGEIRPAAPTADIPPPPACDIAGPAESSPFVLSLTGHSPATPVAETGTTFGRPDAATSRMPAADGDSDLTRFWCRARGRIADRTVYPPSAVRRGAVGQVMLYLRVDTRGKLLHADVATSSADTALDRAALAAVREAAPFPTDDLARGAATNVFEALIPVRFELVDEPGSDWGFASKR